MARIRTIKPDFFTSDDICALTPLARLLYVALWCEADREGRLAWAPRVLKRRYLPDDSCDIEALAAELLERRLVMLYGDGLAFIPSFARHQHLNAREAASKLPPPEDDAVGDAPPRVGDVSASADGAPARAADAHAGKEGKEKEGKGEGSRAHALPESWKPEEEDLVWARSARPDLDPAGLAAETERFVNHARAHQRTAHCWGPNWRLWVSKAHPPSRDRRDGERVSQGVPENESDLQWRARLRHYRPGRLWLEGDWGPRPESGRSRVPPHVLAEWQAGQRSLQ